MSSTDVKDAPATPAADTEQEGGWTWLDTAGLVAGAVLVAIVIDVVTDGRFISRRLVRRPQQPEAQQPEVPVEPQ